MDQSAPAEPRDKPLTSKGISWNLLIAAELLVALIFLAYSNTFRDPYIRDDSLSIVDNPTITHLWPPGAVLAPPHRGETVGGRPLLNVSFALNYAAGGLDPWGYHCANVLIHAGAALLLLGIVRRTLLQPRLAPAWGRDADLLALAAAGLWALHPLQTESVTYVVQRAESLMGLCYFATVYCFVRYAEAPGRRAWAVLSVAACLLGAATKEVIATAPAVLLLYDRTFLAGSFREAWRRRRGLYLALAATWIPLAALVAGIGSAVAIRDLAWRDYVLMQFYAVVEYLRLAAWPSPLIFDYSGYVIRNRWVIGGAILLVAALLALTLAALRRRPAAGFAAACYFIILSPSSSVVVASRQTLCDHRMYVPLAPVVALVVLAAYRWLGRGSLAAFAVLALAAGGATYARNQDYRTALALWTETVKQLPESASAHGNRAGYLIQDGRLPEAEAESREALRLDPLDTTALNNLGLIAFYRGHPDEAIAWFQRSLRANSRHVPTYYFYGYVQEQAGRIPEAIALYRGALRLRPWYPEVQARLAALEAKR